MFRRLPIENARDDFQSKPAGGQRRKANKLLGEFARRPATGKTAEQRGETVPLVRGKRRLRGSQKVKGFHYFYNPKAAVH